MFKTAHISSRLKSVLNCNQVTPITTIFRYTPNKALFLLLIALSVGTMLNIQKIILLLCYYTPAKFPRAPLDFFATGSSRPTEHIKCKFKEQIFLHFIARGGPFDTEAMDFLHQIKLFVLPPSLNLQLFPT